jgi:hypothetical protein
VGTIAEHPLTCGIIGIFCSLSYEDVHKLVDGFGGDGGLWDDTLYFLCECVGSMNEPI